ncbi:zinc ABC transporter substrate-binding protein [Aquibium sp. A9E412]|uniref:zinc ABC transporter substrate-binding protein n=1 Tax=Aquibium sp. A9E412 TaxID=2976767 RepID=UPI0025B03BB7|nr:zinc ABC transporter substrate-binding protein [Aquibium sp. A9E412]MDN2564920.1 zinc ABC transporter substrate-binding protein [Aquibium sp. A9E412]
MRNGLTGALLAAGALAWQGVAGAAAAAPDVVVSIKPVHALVAAVMEGVGTPQLLIEGAGSPHSYSLKPSQAAAIEDADVVFWIGPQLETFLQRPLATLGREARTVALIESEGLTRLGFRSGSTFEAHAHDDDDHDHAHGEDDGHGHDHAADAARADDDAHGHDDGLDPHVWLDPANAAAMTERIAAVLGAVDPDNAARYRDNAAAAGARLAALTAEVTAMLEPVRGRGFVVFHDGYRYFEERFGVTAAGALTVNPEVAPGAERVAEIREAVRRLDAVCVFAEPQFEPRLVAVVSEGTGARSAVLDPLGADLDDGPELYFALIRGMATAMRDCLAEAG